MWPSHANCNAPNARFGHTGCRRIWWPQLAYSAPTSSIGVPTLCRRCTWPHSAMQPAARCIEYILPYSNTHQRHPHSCFLVNELRSDAACILQRVCVCVCAGKVKFAKRTHRARRTGRSPAGALQAVRQGRSRSPPQHVPAAIGRYIET